MRKIINLMERILMWFIVLVLFILAFDGGIGIHTVLLLVAALLIAPIKPIRDFIKIKIGTGKMVIVAIIMFLAGVITTPDINTEQIPGNSEVTQGAETVTISVSPMQGDRITETVTLPPIHDTSPVITNNPIPTETPVSDIGNSYVFSMIDIPEYTDNAYVVLNNNIPVFSGENLVTSSSEEYSSLDNLGRTCSAFAVLGQDLMPNEGEERGDINEVYPSGWEQGTYDFIEDGYLYNRCHLIGWQLSAENDNEKNLLTGTRYFNVEGMLPFENMVAGYIQETGNHVAYRVTPVYTGNNLLANGVIMEAYSVEDSGAGICFNVFCYNVEPGVEIDYSTGHNWVLVTGNTGDDEGDSSEVTYIINTNSKKFHYPSCNSVADMAEHNKKESCDDRDTIIANGYESCGRCRP